MVVLAAVMLVMALGVVSCGGCGVDSGHCGGGRCLGGGRRGSNIGVVGDQVVGWWEAHGVGMGWGGVGWGGAGGWACRRGRGGWRAGADGEEGECEMGWVW